MEFLSILILLFKSARITMEYNFIHFSPEEMQYYNILYLRASKLGPVQGMDAVTFLKKSDLPKVFPLYHSKQYLKEIWNLSGYNSYQSFNSEFFNISVCNAATPFTE